MEDQYFKSKANEVFKSIKTDYDKGAFSDVEIKSYIYMALKEVARDQRYACVDASNALYRNVNGNEQSYAARINSEIQNAQIKEG